MRIHQSNKYKSMTAVITGANGGIGRSTAIELAAKGMNLILCTRQNSEEWEIWVKELLSNHKIEVKCFQFDFASEDEVRSAAKDINRANKVDYLINCAGIPFGATVLMTRIEDLQRVLNVNFINQVLFTQHFVKRMYSQRSGVIVNIASMSGLGSEIGTLAYGASKAALVHFTKVLAAESGKYGVRVNAICPGVIQTNMLNFMDPRAIERQIAHSAEGRIGLPEEIAQTVEFLISDSSTYISGQAIKVNGGEIC